MPGGLESPLAVQYGIASLPVMFLVGPDGKVVSRHVAGHDLDDELRKLLKAGEGREGQVARPDEPEASATDLRLRCPLADASGSSGYREIYL